MEKSLICFYLEMLSLIFRDFIKYFFIKYIQPRPQLQPQPQTLPQPVVNTTNHPTNPLREQNFKSANISAVHASIKFNLTFLVS